KGPYYFFEPVYALGGNPMQKFQSQQLQITEIENDASKKITEVKAGLPSVPLYIVDYILYKKEKKLVCHYRFDKNIEKNKESMHIAFPFRFDQPTIEYGNDNY